MEYVQRIYLAEKKKNLPDLVVLGGNSGKVVAALVLPNCIVRVEVYCGRESLENVINSKGISIKLHTTYRIRIVADCVALSYQNTRK